MPRKIKVAKAYIPDRTTPHIVWPGDQSYTGNLSQQPRSRFISSNKLSIRYLGKTRTIDFRSSDLAAVKKILGDNKNETAPGYLKLTLSSYKDLKKILLPSKGQLKMPGIAEELIVQVVDGDDPRDALNEAISEGVGGAKAPINLGKKLLQHMMASGADIKSASGKAIEGPSASGYVGVWTFKLDGKSVELQVRPGLSATTTLTWKGYKTLRGHMISSPKAIKGNFGDTAGSVMKDMRGEKTHL